MNIQDMPDILTPTEVGAILKISPITVKRKAKKNWIKSIRINSRGDFRFFKTDVMKILGIHE